ncbi:MAG: enoyl-CoA hydratase/isomerase family protein [Planctomycetota bacterium]|nr:enoyl-CoA hydratase/isomerase family protein [Planctomycetota bacterium]
MRIEMMDGVAVMRLEGGKANAMSPDWVAQVAELVKELEASDASSVVMTGYDKYFSAGLDLVTLMGMDRDALRRFIVSFGHLTLSVFRLNRPLIAAVNGHAIAGGCVLAQQADYRFMVNGKAKTGLREIALGVGLPIVVVETARLRLKPEALIPVCYEGGLFSAAQACALGLMDEAVAPEDLETAALEKARSLGSMPGPAFAHIKNSWRRPAVEAIEANLATDTEAWLDTWYSDEAQGLIGGAIEQMGGPRKGG